MNQLEELGGGRGILLSSTLGFVGHSTSADLLAAIAIRTPFVCCSQTNAGIGTGKIMEWKPGSAPAPDSGSIS